MRTNTCLGYQHIYIIIPVYNHAEQLRSIVSTLKELGYAHIVVVNDGSEQDIDSLVNDLDICYLKHRQNLGQGAALQTGFDYALSKNADIAVSFDADGQHDPADLESILKPILSGEADLSLGSRFLASQPTNLPAQRKMVLKLARWINYLFTGIQLTDAHNGFRALNRLALQKIYITENRMAHATEILIEARKHQLKICEVPVTIHYTAYSKQYGQSSWNSIRIFFDLVFYKLFA